ncbi:MAG: leucyl aminopeptidase family protein [Pseudomonadota bacterium]|nr:leucyl aminopeptidase family protein [Pseudomonadota bacterium]
MPPKLIQHKTPFSPRDIRQYQHVLCILPHGKMIIDDASIVGLDTLKTMLKRRGMKADELATTPLAGEIGSGALAAWAMVDPSKPVFEQHTSLRKALALLLQESAERIAVSAYGEPAFREQAARFAIYAGWLNSAKLPQRKKKSQKKSLKEIGLFGATLADSGEVEAAIAAGNTLTRALTLLPPNELTPAHYRKRIAVLAKEWDWSQEIFDMKKLRKLGAGAFVAVAQGSAEDDASIIHLRYRGKNAKQTIALVGKGICFDTGGHNLKPAKYMYGMHEDMNGSAVALGALLSASTLKLPVNIDCWLALAQNHISPQAYKQNDVVKALNGTTIEIVHTDAEGRMVLADTLTLASRAKPDLIVDYATLTGSMHVSLGTRMSGIFTNRPEWQERAIRAGTVSGERVTAFPLESDYDAALESKIADVKQCSDDGNADHILAARFLSKFIDDRPWIHMDLSASSHKGGLGAVASDVTGFGVAWTIELLKSVLT